MPGAGTDKTKTWVVQPGPCVILVEPQLADNIGSVARAMANFGLAELRLVSPRQGWPHERAYVMAAGADRVLDGATLFDSVEAAVGDLNFIFAATARAHDQAKPVVDPGAAAALSYEKVAAGMRVGLMFGRERNGLDGPDFLPALHRELIAVISKYAKVNPEDIKVSLDRQGNLEVLDVNVVLPDAATS